MSSRVLRDFAGWPAGPLHLALGVFDGVHRGHSALIARLADGARRGGARAIAATFDPLPIEVLAPAAPPSALSDVDERATHLTSAGADDVVAFRYDERFAALAAREFVERLAGAGEVRRIVAGPDFRFGHGREGDVRLLHELGAKHGYAVDVIEPLVAGNAVVSSTRIRNALAAGDVDEAAALLGRSYAVRGTVVHGEKRGRALGYPTINIATPPARLLPKDGIYAVWVHHAGARHPAAASLGVRPTFGAGARALEAYLLDWSGDLYDETVGVAFARRLRDERYFESADALADQIAKDVQATRTALVRPSH